MEQELTFNDLPQVVAGLRDEVAGMRETLELIRKESRADKERVESTHRPMSAKEAADYLRMPLRTLYLKLSDGTLPAVKPCKRYIIYRDELDKWLECARRNPVPMTAEEENAAILSSNRRKPNNLKW